MALSKSTNWVQEYQAPFDQQMASMPDGPQKTALMQQYLSNLNQFAAFGGSQAKTAQGAKQTFDQYYGPAYTAATQQAAPVATPAPAEATSTADPFAAFEQMPTGPSGGAAGPYVDPNETAPSTAAPEQYITPPDSGATSEVQPAAAPAPAAATPAAGSDPWSTLAAAYGLGAPPAQGLPATITAPNMGAAPQADAALIDPSTIPQVQGAQIDPNAIPQTTATQMPISDEIKAMASGQGYSPAVIAQMKALATEQAATAGTQQMGQTKRLLGQNGISGGANAAVLADVARQTGQAQSTALSQIDIKNADVGNANAQFGIGQETNIGENNMQAANTMALENASKLFSGLQANQASTNNAAQFNAGNVFAGEKANQDSKNTTSQMNTGLAFQRQNDQSNMDYNNTKSQWDELNKRYSQSQNILGSWGAAA